MKSPARQVAQIEIEEEAIPLQPEVRSACEVLGLDPLAMANEGRMLVICPASEADAASDSCCNSTTRSAYADW